MEDLRNHLRSSHEVNKKDLSEHIMKTMEEQIKKQESSAEVVTLDEDEEKEKGQIFEEQSPVNFKQPILSSKGVKATDEDVKDFFKLKAESVIEAMLKAGHGNVEVSLSFEEVMAKLTRMKKEVRNIVKIIYFKQNNL